MELTIKEIFDKKEKEIISREILNDLPEWFGMPESTEEYVVDSQDKPFLACFIHDEVAGFYCVERHKQRLCGYFCNGN